MWNKKIIRLPAVLTLALLPALASAEPARLVDSTWWRGLSSLRIQYQMDTVALVRRGDAWFLKESGLPANAARVRAAWRVLSSVRGEETLPAGRSLEEVGLDEIEARTVDLGRGWFRRSVRLKLGHPVTDPVTTYWMRAPSPTVYRASSRAWSIPTDPLYWLDKNLLPPLRGSALKSVRVAWRDSVGTSRTYEVRHDSAGKSWLFGPDGRPRLTVKGAEVFFQAGQFLIDALPGPGEKPPAGPAAVSVRIELPDGKAHLLEAKGPAGKHYYVRHPVYGKTVKILRGRFDVFKRTLEDLGELPEQGAAPPPSDSTAVADSEELRPPARFVCPFEHEFENDHSGHDHEQDSGEAHREAAPEPESWDHD